METPRICPVCGQDSIQPITRIIFVKLGADELPGVLAYRCGQGHVFLVSPPQETDQSRTIKK